MQIQLPLSQESNSILQPHHEGNSLFKQSGGILVQVDDKEALVEELKEGLEKFQSHVQHLVERESELRDLYETLVKKLEVSK